MRLFGAIPPPAGACIRAFSACLCLCLPAAQADLAKPRGSYAVETAATVPAGGETVIELRILDFRKKPAFGRLPEFEFEVDRPPLSGSLVNWRQMPRIGDSDRATVTYRHDPSSPSDSDGFTFRATPTGGGDLVAGEVTIRVLRAILETTAPMTSLGTGTVGETLRGSVSIRNQGGATASGTLSITPPYRLAGIDSYAIPPAGTLEVPIELALRAAGRTDGTLILSPYGLKHRLTATGIPCLQIPTNMVTLAQSPDGRTEPAFLAISNLAPVSILVTLQPSPPFQVASNLLHIPPRSHATAILALPASITSGSLTGRLAVASDLQDAEVPIRAILHAPAFLKFEPQAIEFGELTTENPPSNATVEVVNTGELPWTGTFAADNPFLVRPSRMVLPAGRTGTVTVTFTPSRDGRIATNLRVAGGRAGELLLQARVASPPRPGITTPAPDSMPQSTRDFLPRPAPQGVPAGNPDPPTMERPSRTPSMFIMLSPDLPRLHLDALRLITDPNQLPAVVWRPSPSDPTSRLRLVAWTPTTLTPTGILVRWAPNPDWRRTNFSTDRHGFGLADIDPARSYRFSIEALDGTIPVARSEPVFLDAELENEAAFRVPFKALLFAAGASLLGLLLAYRRNCADRA